MKNMKKFVAALLVLTMVLALCTTAFAYKEKEYFGVFQFKGSAWGYDKVTNQYGKGRSNICLRKGSIVYVEAQKGKWNKVWIPGRIGKPGEYKWFNGDYMKELKDYTGGSVYIYASGGSSRSEQQGDVIYTKSLKGLKVKTSGKVNLRKTASLKGKSLGTVKKGKKVRLTGNWGYDTRGIWFFEVKANGKKGFISEIYIDEKDMKKILNKIPFE